MIDTNSISQIRQAAPAAQQALNAWTIVAAAAGAFVTHFYHTIVAGGGVKNIVKKFWNGDATKGTP
jgi:hypothetical protein